MRNNWWGTRGWIVAAFFAINIWVCTLNSRFSVNKTNYKSLWIKLDTHFHAEQTPIRHSVYCSAILFSIEPFYQRYFCLSSQLLSNEIRQSSSSRWVKQQLLNEINIQHIDSTFSEVILSVVHFVWIRSLTSQVVSVYRSFPSPGVIFNRACHLGNRERPLVRLHDNCLCVYVQSEDRRHSFFTHAVLVYRPQSVMHYAVMHYNNNHYNITTHN